jgi:hypothetical protein
VALALGLAAVLPGGAVQLRYKFKAGEKLVYHDRAALAMEISGMGDKPERLQIRSDSRVRQTVKSAGGGGATLETETIENSTETIPEKGERKKSEEKGHPQRVKIDDRGLVSERKNLGKDVKKDNPFDEFAIIQAVFDHLRLPEGDVDEGKEWTETFEVNVTPGLDKPTLAKASATSRFARLVKVKGVECVEIITEFSLPYKTPKAIDAEGVKLTLDGQMTGKLTQYFAPAQGQSLVEMATVGSAVTVTVQPLAGKADKITMQQRLKVNTKTVLET